MSSYSHKDILAITKLIPKNTCTLGILKSSKTIAVHGSQLMKRSHERLEMLA